MAAPTDKSEITLGFVEKCENWRLTSKFFPSKVGGKPAWLSLNDIPCSDTLKCRNCGSVCIFLMQVYCPIAEEHMCFHRTLFIFCCKNPTCHKAGDSAAFVVLRSQLPRANEFYDFEPPDEDSLPSKFDEQGANKLQTVEGFCVVCGCHGGKRCAKCQSKSYCSREHQVIDWKAGHKQKCGVTSDSSVDGSLKVLFPEFELVTEAEEYTKPNTEDDYRAEEATQEGRELSADELQKMASVESKEDKVFAKFKKRIDHERDQVIRYRRGGQPLLISSQNQPKDNDIPPCDTCGSARQYEFQVMPQLLLHLGVDNLETSIDWGTLIVYTCAKSCDDGPAYRPEFLWKQDIVASEA